MLTSSPGSAHKISSSAWLERNCVADGASGAVDAAAGWGGAGFVHPTTSRSAICCLIGKRFDFVRKMFHIKTQLKLTPSVVPSSQSALVDGGRLRVLLGARRLASSRPIPPGLLRVHLYIFDYTTARQVPLIVFDWSKREIRRRSHFDGGKGIKKVSVN